MTYASAQASPEQRSTEFVAVQGGPESSSAETLLVTAYALMWLILLAFLGLSFRRQLRLETRLGELEKHLKRSGA